MLIWHTICDAVNMRKKTLFKLISWNKKSFLPHTTLLNDSLWVFNVRKMSTKTRLDWNYLSVSREKKAKKDDDETNKLLNHK